MKPFDPATLVLATEDQAAFAHFRAAWERDYPAQTAAERFYLSQVIASAWKVQRTLALETAHLNQALPNEPKLLMTYARLQDMLDRGFHRNLRALTKSLAGRAEKNTNKPNLPATPEIRTIEPNPPAPIQTSTNEPNPTPVDESLYRQLEQQIIAHGHRAAFREDEPETCYADDALEFYFRLKDKIPLEHLARYVRTLTEDLS